MATLRTFFCCFLAAALMAMTSPTRAQSKVVEDIPPGEDRIVPLQLSMPAPFAGQLFDNSTALRWANWLRQYKLRLRVDVEEQKQLCAVSTEALSRELQVEKEKYQVVVSGYDAQVLQLRIELSSTPWHKNVWVGMLIGAGITALTTTALLSVAH